MNTKFQLRTVSAPILTHIFETVTKKAQEMKVDASKKRIILVENLMLREYLNAPEIRYAEMYRRVCTQYDGDPHTIDEAYIERRAERLKMNERNVRKEIAKFAYETATRIYAAMSDQSKETISLVKSTVENESDSVRKRAILFALFEYIPQLSSSPVRDLLITFPMKTCDVTLNGILQNILLDIEDANKKKALDPKDAELEALRRELYLAQDELKTFKRFVEESDLSFDNKIQEMLSQEIIAFFRQLNNKKYDYLIDSAYVQSKAFREYKKTHGSLPQELEGAAVFFAKFLQLIREEGMQPATKYPPNSIQNLTREQMLNADFEPSPNRKAPLSAGEAARVRVVSCGWNYKDKNISSPIFYEEEPNQK